jgi:hypothetical protein
MVFVDYCGLLDEMVMNQRKHPARVAGLLYLLVAITGAFGIAVVPFTLIARGDATSTADRIRSSEWLFRLGMTSELIAATAYILLAIALYRLFRRVNEEQARLMVTLVLVSVPISYLNVLNELAALVLLSGPDFLSVFTRPQLDALALLFLGLHSQGFVVASIFWGLWLLPLGALVIGSGFAPRLLGYLLILAGLAYVVDSFTSMLLPRYRPLVAVVAPLLEGVGELSMVAWLLITSANERSLDGPDRRSG